MFFLNSLRRKEGHMEPEIRYLNEQQVGQIVGRALSTLRNERAAGKGIPYIKAGRSVRYNLADVVRYMEERKVETNNN
jgi:hypothetical protein